MSQREAVLASASYCSGKLEEGLAEAFLAVEQRMKDQSARRELYCLREGARAVELLVLERLLAAPQHQGRGRRGLPPALDGCLGNVEARRRGLQGVINCGNRLQPGCGMAANAIHGKQNTWCALV
jgi:hypothetical protein